MPGPRRATARAGSGNGCTRAVVVMIDPERDLRARLRGLHHVGSQLKTQEMHRRCLLVVSRSRSSSAIAKTRSSAATCIQQRSFDTLELRELDASLRLVGVLDQQRDFQLFPSGISGL
jgi:hypothetical protein